VGINESENPALNLTYATPDARAVEESLAAASGGLFKEIRRRELFDGAATKKAIMAELSALKDSAPQDVVVVYLAGHGTTAEDAWYFVPHELVYPEREEALRASAISSGELQEKILGAGARKILLLMDACRSGGALLSRGLEERRALAMLARAAGVHIVAASTKDQMASEVSTLGHGVFTQALLDAIAGKADGNPKDGTVTVRELLTYIESDLPELSRKYRSQPQYPVVDSRGMDFPLARPR